MRLEKGKTAKIIPETHKLLVLHGKPPWLSCTELSPAYATAPHTRIKLFFSTIHVSGLVIPYAETGKGRPQLWWRSRKAW